MQKSLNRILGDISYDVFFYLWKEDLGNKTRKESQKKYELLLSNPRTKAFLLADPYEEKDYVNSVGVSTNSNSSINATMGMFLSMSILSNYLELLPDKDEYTHIFRLRTDCLVFDCLEDKIKKNQNKVLVSNNFFVPPDWISDHIMIAPKSLFYSFWRFTNMNDIFKAYKKGKRIPEKTLQHLAKTNRNIPIKLLNRGVDYHIIYTPPRETDPAFIQKAINEHGVEYLFDNISEMIKLSPANELEISLLYKQQLAIKDPYSLMTRIKSSLKSFFKKS